MTSPPTLYNGKAFTSCNELFQFMTEYQSYHRQKFWRRSSRKITSTPNIRRHIKPELIYYEINYSCIHGGEKFKSRSRGLRKSITFRLGSPCPAYIRFRASPCGQSLLVKAFCDKHNHIDIQNRWSVSQVEALISEYKKYPVLYDAKHEQNQNEEFKKQCLMNIVEALPISGITEVDVISQWNNLLYKYANAQALQKNSLEPQFWYLEKLDFLNDYVNPDFEQSEFLEPEITTETHEWDTDPLSSAIKEEVNSPCDESPQDEKGSKDESDIFGEFVAAQLKKITDEGVKQDVILEIHQILHRVLTKKTL